MPFRSGRRVPVRLEDLEGVLEKLREELAEFTAAVGRKDAAQVALEFGDILFTLVNVARFSGVHPKRHWPSRSKNSSTGSARWRKSSRTAAGPGIHTAKRKRPDLGNHQI